MKKTIYLLFATLIFTLISCESKENKTDQIKDSTQTFVDSSQIILDSILIDTSKIY